jgi:hypothetical protein
LGKDFVKPAALKATTLLLWDAALKAARGGRKKRSLTSVG